MSSGTPAKSRIISIDVAKGILILSVIFAHTLPVGGHGIGSLMRGIIFSFHMPAFFILSGVTSSEVDSPSMLWRQTKRTFIRLFLPALGIFILRGLFELLTSPPPMITGP